MALSAGQVSLSIIADTSKFAGDLTSKISGTLASVSSGIGSTLAGGFKSVAAIGATTIAGFVGGVTTLAATGGFNRALAIENAQAKLTGLGHSSEQVQGIMNDALARMRFPSPRQGRRS